MATVITARIMMMMTMMMTRRIMLKDDYASPGL